MTALERTAYPRFKSYLTKAELEQFYTPTTGEMALAQEVGQSKLHHLVFLILLKSFQKLGYLPFVQDIPQQIRHHLAYLLGLPAHKKIAKTPQTTRNRYKEIIYHYLKVRPYGARGSEYVTRVVNHSAYTMSDPADLINVALEELARQRLELPAFGTLDRLVNHLRHQVHQQLYQQITVTLTSEQLLALDSWIQGIKGEADPTRTLFTRLKKLPQGISLNAMTQWQAHLLWLESLMVVEPFLEGVAYTKIKQFAAQAYQMEISDIRGVHHQPKKYALLICLLYQMQVQTRDQLLAMFLKRTRRIEIKAENRLAQLREEQQEITEHMVETLANIVDEADTPQQDALLGQKVRQVLASRGGTKQLRSNYQLLAAYHNHNYLPLMIIYYRPYRAVLFRLTQQLLIRTATQEQKLLQALEFIQSYQVSSPKYVPATISLAFASLRWQALIRQKVAGKELFDRRQLELCVFIYLAEGLQQGNLYVIGSESHCDYRQQLLSWDKCQPLLHTYALALNLPTTAAEFVVTLRQKLTDLAHHVDITYPNNEYLTFDVRGKPHLKRLARSLPPKGTLELEHLLKERLPERHLLDILQNVHHWVGYTRHFTPPSGADPKLIEALSRYLLTIFGYGCNLGPAQMARHSRGRITARSMRLTNEQHITTEKLDAAIRDIVNDYARFRLPFLWGTGHSAIADGTQFELYENNLLGERHIRYGGYGGIAYHHISDTYVALFSHFIACGVWEAVYILDGLLKNKSTIQPHIVHADTQGQAKPVFGLAYLLGIKLMPRMRNWNKVTFYKPSRDISYQNINSLFTRVVNWELIETHWQDLMQVVLSIHTGKILPSFLLHKLGSHSKQHHLYQAFDELGRVIRTLFLLEYISDVSLRQQVGRATIKVESYNGFSKWIVFGGWGIITAHDPVEQEKRIKYKDVIANAIMLQNVVDITNVLQQLVQEGHLVTTEMVATFSPYLTGHIKRFGEYVLNIGEVPEPLQPDKEFLTPSSTSGSG